jgi:hypothetical protein
MAGAVLLGCVHSSGRVEVSQSKTDDLVVKGVRRPARRQVEMFFPIPSVIVNGYRFEIASGFRLRVGAGYRETWNSTRT